MSRNRSNNRRLNDELRMHLLGGGTRVSPKIAAFDLPRLRRLVERLAAYNDFPKTTDPSGEHAFGTFDFEGATVVFEIIVQPLKASPRSLSSKHSQAERLLTVMLGEESALLNGHELRAAGRASKGQAR